MKEKLRVGIAGYGVVGKRRRYFIDQHPRLKTVAVCDQTFSGSGYLPERVRYHPHYEQLINENLDILFVCLPNYLAADVTIAGLKRGFHVFCEKPPGRDVSDVERVIKAEKQHPKQILKYGFNHRYHESVREAIRIVNSGRFGEVVNLRGIYGKSKIIHFTGQWRSERRYAGGGILLDQGIHMVDLMRLFCGDFVEVKSFISNSYWNHDVEDNAYAIMRDAKGRIALLHSSATQWQHRFSLDVTLQEGCLSLQGILTGSKSYGEEKLIIVKKDESATGTQQEEVITYLDDHSWKYEVEEFVEAILGKKQIFHGNSQEALNTMKLVYHIYSSDSRWKMLYEIPDYQTALQTD